MADCSSHAPGTFTWPELATTDQPAAVAFYRALFGWDVHEHPMGPTETYTLFRMRGVDVAAGTSLRPQDRKHGVPAHWNAYISVNSADESVARAKGLGATVLAPAFDVMDAGRMAVLQDPTGAVFQVWQANKSIGARILGEPGALCWTELATRDTKAATAFYTQFLGWTAKVGGAGTPMEYTEFLNDGKPGAGMMAMPEMVPAEVPAYWMPYFQVASCDESTEKAKTLGATELVGPTDIPNTGRFGVVRDPQGAVFAVFTPAR
jgi:predicted enzyme related to lactoylglutathione lyase